ncbi:MAG: FeoA family protein [Bacilli bacterium]|nr:FeoA family protein [Bacilli bacterium]MDD4808678.1 FeoA family protein [Bacilli bacterium]
MTLNDLKLGSKGRIEKIKVDGKTRQRLIDMGLTEGVIVESALRSPSGDPIAYYIRGTLIAIRNEDSSKVICEAI